MSVVKKERDDLYRFYKTHIKNRGTYQEQRACLMGYLEAHNHSIASAKQLMHLVKDDLKASINTIDLEINVLCIVIAVGLISANRNHFLENIFIAGFFCVVLVSYNLYRGIAKSRKRRFVNDIVELLEMCQ